MVIKEFEDVEVTVYENVMTSTGAISSLAEFLSIDVSMTIARLRSTTDRDVRRRIKMSLPAATISGVFYPNRRLADFVGHSGYICIDIDGKDNPGYDFSGPFPRQLTDWNIISYLSRSASGKGLFALIRLASPQRHHDHFVQLVNEFYRRGFKADIACGDLTRLRCSTFEPSPYYNPNARPHTLTNRPVKATPRRSVFRHDPISADGISAAISAAQRSGMTYLDSYDDWVRAAFALASLGETGRELFHSAAALSPKYKRTESDRLFNNALRKHNGRTSPATFMKILRGR